MTGLPERTFSWRDHAPGTVSSVLFILQIIVGVYLLPEISQIEILAYVGVALYVSSGLILGALPVFELRKKGGVKKGQSYVHTTKVVDTGIYSVVRHPQYVTFIMWAFSGMLLFQHWIVIMLGTPIIPLTYIDLFKEDKACVKRFGEAYETYMKRVPRANFLLGLIRRCKRKL